MFKGKYIILGFLVLILGFSSCQLDPEIRDIDINEPDPKDPDTTDIPDDWVYNPTTVQLEAPHLDFPPIDIPPENPMTEQGIELGKMLFYDPILSGDSSMSCAGCHMPSASFVDPNKKLSIGIDGLPGKRNSMALINVVYMPSLFWDGRSETLEDQVTFPITDPLEMHETWPGAVKKLQRHPDYPKLFYEAFGKAKITPELVSKAIAQFERTLISGNSKFDKFVQGRTSLTPSELRGFNIFNTETGDCFHCHGGIFFTDHDFHNNGLDSADKATEFEDIGFGEVTGRLKDYGKFKTPTLRNIELTAPYMHDGRFQTLEEVIDHYDFGGHPSPTIDPNMKKVGKGLNLTEQQKEDLLNFLKTLTDTSFTNNPAFQNPFE